MCVCIFYTCIYIYTHKNTCITLCVCITCVVFTSLRIHVQLMVPEAEQMQIDCDRRARKRIGTAWDYWMVMISGLYDIITHSYKFLCIDGCNYVDSYQVVIRKMLYILSIVYRSLTRVRCVGIVAES